MTALGDLVSLVAMPSVTVMRCEHCDQPNAALYVTYAGRWHGLCSCALTVCLEQTAAVAAAVYNRQMSVNDPGEPYDEMVNGLPIYNPAAN